ncbi:protein of unknown function UPF0153 [Caldicellulosiruptor saccharolyticus DSM 8903]|uniref:YkgJ family cysteine cluster protein n=1 Tax=Caldicellulosiruptor saccharolyticus (strain ATCC 43494 / DSM 8903 / Tp8T 6331) TaxID=351627 RepID=A4XMT3_CALS8|nr:YkgJ family cysteine cluster protein [Caldicellulosiruptor saccharolyticus]ABP68218.1 protein of unknown function UPF0153 [Caldicellulosiruptor saccharolyticus DSM 8903]
MPSSILFNIPRHACLNCGACCGPVLATKSEIETVKRYVENSISQEEQKRLLSQKKHPLVCPYRDIQMKKCAIYPVRPLICRLFGVVKEMECKYGNSYELDGESFLSPHEEYFFLPNFLKGR